MNLISFQFILFFCCFLVCYYVVPAKHRYIIVFLGSYLFYGYAHPLMLCALAGLTVISYIGGLVIEKYKSRAAYLLFMALEVALLAVFKYTDFIISNINLVAEMIRPGIQFESHWNLVLPLGFSFIVFQTCTYLSDVYRGKLQAEKSIILYASFAAFFPTVLSGPI